MRTTPVSALITDETSKYAASDSSYSNLFRDSSASTSSSSSTISTPAVPTDEYTVVIPASAFNTTTTADQKPVILGIELAEVRFRDNRRVYVKSVAPNSIASRYKALVKDSVVVSVNGVSAERTDLTGVQIMVSRARAAGDQDVVLVLRDPNAFADQLRAMEGSTTNTATTQIAPETTQRLSVQQLVPPPLCRRPAVTDDLLEIAYVGRVQETGLLFDGTTIAVNKPDNAVPGRGGDISLYLVLGRQTAGQFPPGWDVGLQGMCVQEQRRIVVPPALAYGSRGVPRRGIPPDATLWYDVTLISLNGLATPQ